MIKLFRFEDYTVKIDPEALLLKPIRRVWDKDKSKDKSNAMRDLAYMYFMYDPRSDYQYIVDEESRHEQIVIAEGMPKDWKIYTELEEAIKFYRSFETTSMLLLSDTRAAVDRLRLMLREVDLNKTDERGKPIYTLTTITSTIKQIPELIKSLDEAEKAIHSELQKIGRTRGSIEKSILEDLSL